MKVCNKCNINKYIIEFNLNKSGKNGIHSVCKECCKHNNKKYYENNKIKILLKNKEYHINNKENIYNYYKEYEKNRKLIDPLFKLKHNIRSLIFSSFSLSGKKKNTKTSNILGCSFEEFKIHLENQFTPEMNWNNQGTYWHMDHIKPISLAQNEQEIIELNHYTNFQPLYWEDNLKKSNKYTF